MFKMPEEFDTVALSDGGAVMEVEAPNGVVPRGDDGAALMTITLLGSDSTAYRKAQNAQLNKRLAKRNVKLTAEELEAETIDTLAACTVGWTGFVGEDGQPVPCSAKNAAMLYRKYPFIREQADRFINERQNFLPKSSAN